MSLRALAAPVTLALTLPLLGAGPPIPGLRASGTIVVQANLQGQPLNIGGNVAACYVVSNKCAYIFDRRGKAPV